MFPSFFEIFQVGMLRSFMLKTQNGLPKGLVHRAKIGRQTKKVDFFKVGDTLTMIYLGEKKHLSDVSSWLKTFYDHLRGYRDNLKFLTFSYFSYSYKGICAGNVSNAGN